MGTVVMTILGVLLVSLIAALVLDGDVRDAVTTVAWAMIVGPFMLMWMGAVVLLRLLPSRIRPPRIRGRALSVRALRRVADQAAHDGWMVSSRNAAIIVIRRKKADS